MEDMIALQGILLNGEKLDSPEKAEEFNTALQKLIEIGGSALDCLLDERFLKKQDSPEFIEAMFRYSSVLDQPKYHYASGKFCYVLYRLYQNGCSFFDKNSEKEQFYLKKAEAHRAEADALEHGDEVISEQEKALSYLENAEEKSDNRTNDLMNRSNDQGTASHGSTGRVDHPATWSEVYQKPYAETKKGPYLPIIGGIAHLIAGFMLLLWLISLTERQMEIRLLIFGLIPMAVFAMHLRHAIHSGKYEETKLYGSVIGCRYWCIGGMALPCAFGWDTGGFLTKIVIIIWVVGFVFAYFIKSKACFSRIYKFFMDEKS